MLPDGTELTLFAAKLKYRKTQCLIAFLKFRHLKLCLSGLLVYCYVHLKMFAQGVNVPHYLHWRAERQQYFLNGLKAGFSLAWWLEWFGGLCVGHDWNIARLKEQLSMAEKPENKPENKPILPLDNSDNSL